eukprot:91452_1
MDAFEYWSCGCNETGSHGNGSEKDIEVLKKMKYLPHHIKISTITSGKNGSTYILSNNNTLMVCGHSTLGQLGIEYCDDDRGFTDLLIQSVFLIVNWWNFPALFPPDLTSMIYEFSLYKNSNMARRIFEERNYFNLSTLQYPIIVNNFKIKHISQGIEANHVFITTLKNEIYGAGDNEWNKIAGTKAIGWKYHSLVTNSLSDQTFKSKLIRWTKIDYFNGISIKQIACSYSYTMFLTNNGQLYCRGSSHQGGLGLGMDITSTDKEIVPKIELNTNIKYVACGMDHTLALTEEGNVLFWGKIDRIGTHNREVIWGKDIEWTPKYIKCFQSFDIEIIEIQCGSVHNLCLDKNGRMYSWGNNVYNQCGISTGYEYTNEPYKLENNALKDEKIIDIKCGRYHNICKTEEANFYLWGSNFYNECLVEGGISVEIPTKYNGKLIVNDMYPGYNSTFVSVLRC